MNHLNKTAGVMITGATGYIGSMLVKKITETPEVIRRISEEGGIPLLRLILPVRNLEKAKQQLVCCMDKHDVEIVFIETSLENLKNDNITKKVDYIIHCAAPTKSGYMISNPVETIDSIVTGTKNVLEIAKAQEINSMVYLSSMEVYGSIECKDNKRVSEDECGYIDACNERSSYPLGKRMAENLCYSYYKEYGVPVKIARLSQTFGSGIHSDETRVFAQFANAVCDGKDIVLHTSGNSVGNYCDIEDTIEALIAILQDGKNGEAYNVVNEKNTMTIAQMAELVAKKVAKGKINVVYDIPEGNPYGYAMSTGLRLSSGKIEKLGWKPKTDMETMYRRLIDDLLSNRQ